MGQRGGRTARRRLPPEQRRQELLEHAAYLFSKRPYERVTVAEVAERAEVSEGLVFRYFEDKRALYVEAIGVALALAAAASDVPDPALSPTARFDRGLSGFVELIERFPYAIPQILQAGAVADPEITALVSAAFERLVDRIIGRMGVEDASERLRSTVDAWLSFVQVSTARWIQQGRSQPREELLRTQIVVFRAVAAEALGVEPRPSAPDGPPPLLP